MKRNSNCLATSALRILSCFKSFIDVFVQTCQQRQLFVKCRRILMHKVINSSQSLHFSIKSTVRNSNISKEWHQLVLLLQYLFTELLCNSSNRSQQIYGWIPLIFRCVGFYYLDGVVQLLLEASLVDENLDGLVVLRNYFIKQIIHLNRMHLVAAPNSLNHANLQANSLIPGFVKCNNVDDNLAYLSKLGSFIVCFLELIFLNQFLISFVIGPTEILVHHFNQNPLIYLLGLGRSEKFDVILYIGIWIINSRGIHSQRGQQARDLDLDPFVWILQIIK